MIWNKKFLEKVGLPIVQKGTVEIGRERRDGNGKVVVNGMLVNGICCSVLAFAGICPLVGSLSTQHSGPLSSSCSLLDPAMTECLFFFPWRGSSAVPVSGFPGQVFLVSAGLDTGQRVQQQSKKVPQKNHSGTYTRVGAGTQTGEDG